MGAAEVGCTQHARQARTHVCGASVADVGMGRTCSCGRAQGWGRAAFNVQRGPAVLPVSRKQSPPGTWPSTTSSRVDQGRKLEIGTEEVSFQHQMRVTLIGKNPCWHNQVPGRGGWMDTHLRKRVPRCQCFFPGTGPGQYGIGAWASPREVGEVDAERERECVCAAWRRGPGWPRRSGAVTAPSSRRSPSTSGRAT